MTTTTVATPSLTRRPMRADARRNYDKLIEAARAAFGDAGAQASLEDIARRADVGIGTLYRHFPTRQDLLEAVYVEEVEALCNSAADFAEQQPWDALVSWLNRFVGYVATKRAIADEIMATVGLQTEVFRKCHDAIFTAGEPLFRRAQDAGSIRRDVVFPDVVRLVSGVTMIKTATPDEIERILAMALDGLRYNAPDSEQGRPSRKR
ncbi:MAG: transcriptional regulator TetR family [Pseudonocardiales bacterium]|nr:transcriptional regulator TetR family [Pseudonocardiales bacterium]